jgi:hypothetical protein
VTTRAGRIPAKALVTCVPKRAWQRLSAAACNEIQHLFTTLIARRPVHDALHRLRWSQWRRRHQARARNCHYRRQAAAQL